MGITKDKLTSYCESESSICSTEVYTYDGWFFKFPNLKDYELPRYEFLSNKIAFLLDLNIPDFKLEKVDTELAFCSKLIQPIKNYSLIKAFEYTNDGRYDCNYMIELTKNKQDFVDMCLFDGFVNNTDRHLYNYFYCGEYLMPLFDNHTTYGLKDLDTNKLSVPTPKKSEPFLVDYLEEFSKQNLKTEIINFRNRLKSVDEKIFLEVEKTKLDYNKSKFIKHMQKSLGEIYEFRI